MAGKILLRDDAPLAAATATITVPRRIVTDDDLIVAERILAAPDGTRPPNFATTPFSWVRGQDLPAQFLHTYAREMRHLVALPPELPAEVQTLRLGDLAILGLPGEIFVELGLAIKVIAPATPTAVVGLAKVYLGYVPDKTGFDQGGYETWAARSAAVERGTGERLVATATALLAKAFAATAT